MGLTGSVQISPATSAARLRGASPTSRCMTEAATLSNPSPIADATCPRYGGGSVLTSPLADDGGGNLPQVTTGVSPSGLLVMNQGYQGTPGLVGVVKPSAALNVSDMVGKTYAGFESDPLSPLGTVAVIFGAGSGSGTAITAAIFLTTTSPNNRTRILRSTWSSERADTGLFTSVTLTRPDTFDVCAGTSSGGTDSSAIPPASFTA